MIAGGILSAFVLAFSFVLTSVTPRSATVLFVFARIIALVAVATALGSTAAVGVDPVSVVVVAIAPMLVAPEPITYWLLVPLGMPRLVYVWDSVFKSAFLDVEDDGARCFLAASALVRGSRGDASACAWVQRRIDAVATPDAALAAAAALVASARGDAERARGTFQELRERTSSYVSPTVRKAARRWLLADAARSGDLAGVRRLAANGGGTLRFFELAAARMRRDADAPSDGRLRLAWLLAPSRLATLRVLGRALAVGPRTPRALATPIEQALRAVRSALDDVPPDAVGNVERAIGAIDALRADATWAATVTRRALALSAAPSLDELVAGLEATVVAAAVAHDVVLEKESSSPTLLAVGARVRELRFAKLGELCEPRDTLDDLVITRVREIADLVVHADAHDAAAVYRVVKCAVWDSSVRLSKGPLRYRAHHHFTWLHALAHEVAASQDVPILARNVEVTAPRV